MSGQRRRGAGLPGLWSRSAVTAISGRAASGAISRSWCPHAIGRIATRPCWPARRVGYRIAEVNVLPAPQTQPGYRSLIMSGHPMYLIREPPNLYGLAVGCAHECDRPDQGILSPPERCPGRPSGGPGSPRRCLTRASVAHNGGIRSNLQLTAVPSVGERARWPFAGQPGEGPARNVSRREMPAMCGRCPVQRIPVDLPRAFRTADLRLIHAAICCSRYSSWTCCGVRYWSPECLRFELYQNSMYLTISRYACLASRILGTVNPLVLQGSEERFCHRIIVADPGTADGMPEIMFLQRLRELAGCVIAAAVRVEDSLLGERVITGGHLDGLLDERGLVIIVHGPADHGFRVAVDDRRQIKPSPPRWKCK